MPIGTIRERAGRPRHQLRGYFPAALAAFEDLDAPDALDLLGKAPYLVKAAKSDPGADLRLPQRARRWRHPRQGDRHHGCAARRSAGPAACDHRRLRCDLSGSLIAVIAVLNEQVKTLQGQVGADFGRHPDAEIYLSQPGLGPVAGARVPGEFGDDPDRYASGKARKNYACTSPLTRASGKKKTVMARFIRNDRLTGALMAQALSALGASPVPGFLYDAERARGVEHNAALRKLADRLVGILDGCLKTRTLYDEATAWPHRETPQSTSPLDT